MDYRYSIRWGQRFESAIDRLERLMQNQQKLFVNSSLDAQFELSKLSQISSVLDYQIEFEKLSSKATETHELILVSLFISGLKPEIRWELQLNRPSALKEAFASALYHECRLEDLKHAVTEVEDESKLMINEVDVELPSFESEAEAKEVDDELIDLAVESKTNENIVDECYCNMGEIVKTNQNEEFCFIEIEEVAERAWKERETPLEFNQVVQVEEFICNVNVVEVGSRNYPPVPKRVQVQPFYEPRVIYFQSSREQAKGKLHRDDRCVSSSHKKTTVSNFCFDFLDVCWWRFIFKFYTFKEVYQKSFDFHLEDKVDLKESGMIRP